MDIRLQLYDLLLLVCDGCEERVELRLVLVTILIYHLLELAASGLLQSENRLRLTQMVLGEGEFLSNSMELVLKLVRVVGE